jgi:diphthamide synthase (EF-2-diphthine--ammonia ligase)
MAAGIRPELPLWHQDRRALAEEVLAAGFRAQVVCTDSRFLPDEFCGREYDAAFIRDLPPGVDACGENGEFHTFVFDGPNFNAPVTFSIADFQTHVAPPEYGGVRYRFANLV